MNVKHIILYSIIVIMIFLHEHACGVGMQRSIDSRSYYLVPGTHHGLMPGIRAPPGPRCLPVLSVRLSVYSPVRRRGSVTAGKHPSWELRVPGMCFFRDLGVGHHVSAVSRAIDAIDLLLYSGIAFTTPFERRTSHFWGVQ